ncbi:hypothetical protein IL54_4246 [Sphingobium sp. ba1]|nr:hypothetical protein IL54_4246 [Sphingobium sp. ba1]
MTAADDHGPALTSTRICPKGGR